MLHSLRATFTFVVLFASLPDLMNFGSFHLATLQHKLALHTLPVLERKKQRNKEDASSSHPFFRRLTRIREACLPRDPGTQSVRSLIVLGNPAGWRKTAKG